MKLRDRLMGICSSIVLVLATGSTTLAVEPTKTVYVDCANGKTIAKALTLGDERKPMLIVVKGTCSESVTVDARTVAESCRGKRVSIAHPTGKPPAESGLDGSRHATRDSA